MIQQIRYYLLRFLTPVVDLLGKIRAPFSQKFGIQSYYMMMDVLEPLDIILSRTNGELSNLLNPSKPWKHALFYSWIQTYPNCIFTKRQILGVDTVQPIDFLDAALIKEPKTTLIFDGRKI